MSHEWKRSSTRDKFLPEDLSNAIEKVYKGNTSKREAARSRPCGSGSLFEQQSRRNIKGLKVVWQYNLQPLRGNVFKGIRHGLRGNRKINDLYLLFAL